MLGKRTIVIDSKVSLTKFEEALTTTNESEKKVKLKEYAALIKGHITGDRG